MQRDKLAVEIALLHPVLVDEDERPHARPRERFRTPAPHAAQPEYGHAAFLKFSAAPSPERARYGKIAPACLYYSPPRPVCQTPYTPARNFRAEASAEFPRRRLRPARKNFLPPLRHGRLRQHRPATPHRTARRRTKRGRALRRGRVYGLRYCQSQTLTHLSRNSFSSGFPLTD